LHSVKAPEEQAVTITNRPKADLSVGAYDETISINASNNEASTIVNVNFEVTAEAAEDTTSGGCNVIGYALTIWFTLLLFVLKRKR